MMAGSMDAQESGQIFNDTGRNGMEALHHEAGNGEFTTTEVANGSHISEEVDNAIDKSILEGEKLVIDQNAAIESIADQEIEPHTEQISENSQLSNPSDHLLNIGGTSESGREMQATTSPSLEAVKHSISSESSITGDLFYNIATGDEEGRSRQRILSFAAKRYSSAVERNPEDYDALYNWALVLQESADNMSQTVSSAGKDQLLEDACKKYEDATSLCPTLHEAFYNWAIAISDRAKMRGRTKEAEELWKQACKNYKRAVQLNWNSPQALNNWGLALQELSGIVPIKDRRLIVKTAIKKFRAAIQLQFDFHRAIYNLGTVLYGLAEDTFRSGQQVGAKETTPSDLYSQSAIYIAAAHALKPEYPVYKSALRLVRSMLPLPYLKIGYLTVPPDGNSLAPHSSWQRLCFALDHESLYQVDMAAQKSLGHSFSRRFSGIPSEGGKVVVDKLPGSRIEMADIANVSPCADLSLPPGGGICIDTAYGQRYLIADTWESVDGWVDAIRLVYTIFLRGQSDCLAGIIAG
eukprot:c24337_g1_i1 orf=478-2046(+)